jgi:hypothetical protein
MKTSSLLIVLTLLLSSAPTPLPREKVSYGKFLAEVKEKDLEGNWFVEWGTLPKKKENHFIIQYHVKITGKEMVFRRKKPGVGGFECEFGVGCEKNLMLIKIYGGSLYLVEWTEMRQGRFEGRSFIIVENILDNRYPSRLVLIKER